MKNNAGWIAEETSPFSLQPQEIGISSHQVMSNSTESAHLNEKISQEMFEGIIREVVEEIGVPAESLVKFP